MVMHAEQYCCKIDAEKMGWGQQGDLTLYLKIWLKCPLSPVTPLLAWRYVVMRFYYFISVFSKQSMMFTMPYNSDYANTTCIKSV